MQPKASFRAMRAGLLMAVLLTPAAGPLGADETPWVGGDAAKGERLFTRCTPCHGITGPGGTVYVAGGANSLNLWGLPGRRAGQVETADYSAAMIAAGQAGLVWDEVNFVAYLDDPRELLRDVLNDPSARSTKAFFLRRGAQDIWAYIVATSAQP